MRKIAIAGLMLASTMSFAQTQIEKYEAGGHPQGSFYYLPKTALHITILVEKTTYTPGDLCLYADKYLRLKNVEQTASTTYTVKNISITPYGVPDTTKCYTVKYSGKSVGTNMQLSEDGCLLTINTNAIATLPTKQLIPMPKPKQQDPRNYLSEEILSAGSTAKMAQLVAQEIYEIRESKNQLTRGQADYMPKDGEQLKLMLAELDQQDKALTSMFAGTTQTDNVEYTINYCPETDTKKDVLFRLSKQLGLVEKDDLAGAPYYIRVDNLHTLQMPQDNGKKKKSKEEGIYVNVPEKIKVTISSGSKDVLTEELYAAQFGYTELISGDLFKRNTTKLTLFPNTGGIQKLEAEQPK